MKVSGYHHVAISSSDVMKSVLFYQNVFGGKIIHSFPAMGAEIVLVDIGGAVVEILPNGVKESENNPKLAHLALKVASCQEAYDEAIAGGAVSAQIPTVKMLGTMKICNAFVYGPDQEKIEFFENL